jgi:hypothetical protein
MPRFLTRVERRPVDAVAVSDQSHNTSVGAYGFDDLLSSPRGMRVGRDVDMEDASALERQDEEHVQDVEGDRRHRQKVDGERPGEVHPEERAPRRRRRSPRAPRSLRHVPRDGVLANPRAHDPERSVDRT